MGKCNFQGEWLNKQDCNGCTVSDWLKKANKDDEAFCSVCRKTFSITKGFNKINQHADGKVHKQNCRDKLHSFKLVSGATNTIKLFNANEQARIAELTWALKVVSSNFPAVSADDCGAVFRKMFPEHVPDSFSLSRTKLSYLITDALGPFFREEMIDEAGSAYYSLTYDETTTNAGSKLHQIRVNYWSNKKKQIVSRHLESFFIGHATAEILTENILKSISNANLPLTNLISVASDGPSVNQKVFRLLNEEILSVRKKGILDIGTCTIHTVHNSFLKGLEEYGSDSSDFIISVYSYFNDWPSRWEDFTIIQEKLKVPAHRFLKHVSSRWLTLEPAAKRLLEQWSCLEEYFLRFIPSKKERKILDTCSYKRNVAYLKDKTIKCQLLFLTSSAKLFTSYTSFFQREDPLIHLVHDEVKGLILKVAGRICKQKAVKAFKTDMSEDPFEDSNLLSPDQIIFDEDLQKELAKLSDKERGYFLTYVRNHFIASGRYLLNKGILNNKILQYLRCLKPTFKNSPKSIKTVAKLAQCLPVDIEIDQLLDEWRIIKLEQKVSEDDRIDLFWSNYIDAKDGNSIKYPNLSVFLKSCLSLYHGSAEIERGFSLSQNIISEDRTSMKVRMLNARLNITDVLKDYSNQPALIPMTSKLIKMAGLAHQSYQCYLENEKREKDRTEKLKDEMNEKAKEEEIKQKEAEKNKLKIDVLEKKLKGLNNDVGEQAAVADKLISEGTEKLKTALQKGNITDARVAQNMITAGITANEELKTKKDEAKDLSSIINKRKNNLITNFTSKKPKTS